MYLDNNQSQVWNLISEMSTKIETDQRVSLVTSLNAKFSQDGNQYCYLYGEMPECYVVGFGDTPYLAMCDFYKNFFNQKAVVIQPKNEAEEAEQKK